MFIKITIDIYLKIFINIFFGKIKQFRERTETW